MKCEVLVARNSHSFRELVLQSRIVRTLSVLMTRVLGEPVNARQTIHLLHAQFSFLILMLCCGMGVLVCTLLLSWFVLSVWQCRLQFKNILP